MPSRTHLLNAVNSADLSEWLQYRAEVPPLPDLIDYHLAQLAWIVATTVGGSKIPLENFRVIRPYQPPQEPLSAEELYDKACFLFSPVLPENITTGAK